MKIILIFLKRQWSKGGSFLLFPKMESYYNKLQTNYDLKGEISVHETLQIEVNKEKH